MTVGLESRLTPMLVSYCSMCGSIMFMLVRLETGKTMTCMRYKLCTITFALIINGVALSCFLLRDKPLLM